MYCAVQVVGKLVDRNLEQVGPDLSAFMHIDSDVYNPEFAYCAEVREPALPPSLTLMLKVCPYVDYTCTVCPNH